MTKNNKGSIEVYHDLIDVIDFNKGDRSPFNKLAGKKKQFIFFAAADFTLRV